MPEDANGNETREEDGEQGEAAGAEGAGGEGQGDGGENAGGEAKNQEQGNKAGGEGEGRVTFTPEQQAVFDKRLGKEIEKTRLAAEKTAELEGKVTALTAQVEGGLPVHPEWVSAEDLAAIRQANALEREVAELEANWDGVQDEDPAKVKPPAEIHKRHARAASELAAIKGRADKAHRESLAQFVADAREGKKVRLAREEAARKAKGARGAGSGEGAERDEALNKGGGSKPGAGASGDGGKRGGLDRSKLPEHGQRSVMDVVAAMG